MIINKAMEVILKNKKALVGGSTQGLGKAVALRLAQCGASVTLLARNEDRLRAVLAELSVESGQIHNYIVADYSDFEKFRDIVTSFFGSNTVDVLVNNTNGPEAGTVLEKDISDYQKAFDLLFKTVCHTTLEALPNMKRNNFGRIINLSSITVREPLEHLVLSNTIRTALINWSKTLATEVAKNNITVNNILTGYFDTERINNIMRLQAKSNNLDFADVKNNTVKEVPMKRLGKPEEFAYLVAFLASDFASYITGTNIPIDGGLLKSI
jgi:3-oxoacyl-[acyl-carrier protein] reductase